MVAKPKPPADAADTKPDDTGWFAGLDKTEDVFYPALSTKAHVLVLPLKFGTKAECDLFLDTHVLGKGRMATGDVLAIEIPQ